jgi:hypothetical protein
MLDSVVFMLAQVITQFPREFVQILSRGFCTRAATKLVSGVFVKRKKNNVHVDPSMYRTYIPSSCKSVA